MSERLPELEGVIHRRPIVTLTRAVILLAVLFVTTIQFDLFVRAYAYLGNRLAEFVEPPVAGEDWGAARYAIEAACALNSPKACVTIGRYFADQELWAAERDRADGRGAGRPVSESPFAKRDTSAEPEPATEPAWCRAYGYYRSAQVIAQTEPRLSGPHVRAASTAICTMIQEARIYVTDGICGDPTHAPGLTAARLTHPECRDDKASSIKPLVE